MYLPLDSNVRYLMSTDMTAKLSKTCLEINFDILVLLKLLLCFFSYFLILLKRIVLLNLELWELESG